MGPISLTPHIQIQDKIQGPYCHSDPVKFTVIQKTSTKDPTKHQKKQTPLTFRLKNLDKKSQNRCLFSRVHSRLNNSKKKQQ